MARKQKLPYLEAMRRFERKLEKRAAKREAKDHSRREASRERRKARQDAARLVRISHLRRALADAARHPSLFTAKQLSAIARNKDLPAEARVEAARLLTAWLFAEPEDLNLGVPEQPRGRLRRPRTRK
jgi:ribosomal protein S21